MDGEEAIRRFGESKPDVSMIDVNMPMLDGFATAENLRRVKPNARVVLTSVHMPPSRAFRAGKIGARLLRKPFSAGNCSA